MPTTPDLAYPYPSGSQDADVPSDIQALAERVELIAKRGGEIATHAPAGADEGKIVVCQADGHLAYKVLSGQAEIDADGVITVPPDSLTGVELQDDSVDTRALDVEAVATAIFPAGTIVATGRTAVPGADWLMCDGASKLRTDYGGLFAAIGTNYGSVDGTHFNVPDLRGRAPVGVDGAGGRLTANDAIGNSGGEEKHTLLLAESPSHSHGILNVVINGAGVGNFATGGGLGVTTGGTINSGGGGAHNNMQPFLIVNYMIRT